MTADADDARPAMRGIRPIAGSSCYPDGRSDARTWEGEFEHVHADDARSAVRGTITTTRSNC